MTELRQELQAKYNNLCEEDIHLCISKAIERASAISAVLKEDSGTREDRARELAHKCAEALKDYRLNVKPGGKSQSKSAFLNSRLNNWVKNAYRDANTETRYGDSRRGSFPIDEIGYGMSSKAYHDEKLALQDKANAADSLTQKANKDKRPWHKSSVTGEKNYCRVGKRDCEVPDAPHINKPEGEMWNFYAEIDYKLVQEKINELSLEDNLIEIRYIYELAPAFLPDEILPLLKEMEDNQGKLTRRKKEKAQRLLQKKLLELYLELKKR